MGSGDLVKLEGDRQKDITNELQEALKDCHDFAGVFIAAYIDGGNGMRATRVYYSGLNHLERIGLLEEAKGLSQHPPTEGY